MEEKKLNKKIGTVPGIALILSILALVIILKGDPTQESAEFVSTRLGELSVKNDSLNLEITNLKRRINKLQKNEQVKKLEDAKDSLEELMKKNKDEKLKTQIETVKNEVDILLSMIKK